MKRAAKICSILLISPLVTGGLEAKDPSAKEIIRNVQKKIEKVSLIEAEFIQTFYWSIAEEEEQYDGKVYIGKGDEFRIEIPDQIIVSDGESVWTWSMANQQVIIDYMDQSQESYLPKHMFANYSKEYNVSLKGLVKLDEWECYHLVFISKNPDVFIRKIDVWIDANEWLTRRLVYLDANDNMTTYEIKKIELKANSDPALFRFVPDKSTEVVDLR